MNRRRIALGALACGAVLALAAGTAAANDPSVKAPKRAIVLPEGTVDPAFAPGAAVAQQAPPGPTMAPHARAATTADKARSGPDELLAYVSARRAALAARAKSGPADAALAALTLRKPATIDAFNGLVSRYGLQVTYLEWLVPGTSDHGGTPPADAAAVLAQYPGAQFVYGLAVAKPSDLAAAAADPSVWLVDLGDGSGSPPDLYGSAAKFGKSGS